MATCKACGGSGKVKESGKGESNLPRSGKNPKREESNWKRKPEDHTSTLGKSRTEKFIRIKGKEPRPPKGDEPHSAKKDNLNLSKSNSPKKSKPPKRAPRLGT